jgi:predicted amidohydrolase
MSYQRVNFCSHARAVEDELFVAQACVTGPIECFGLETGYGRSSIMTPTKAPFPENALLAQSPLNSEGMAVADIDFAVLALCRSTGDAKPWQDRTISNRNPLL